MSDITYTSHDGLNLYAKSYGLQSAPLTVLCMHGLTRNHRDFEPMINLLSERYRFISVDVRGRGRSDRATDPATYSPVVYAQDMAALIEAQDLKRLALVGTSMGGLMAMIMTKAMPELICGTVLNDVGPVVEPAGLVRIAAYSSVPKTYDSWRIAAADMSNVHGTVFPGYQDDDWLAFAHRTCVEDEAGRVTPVYDPAITQSLGDSKASWKTNFIMWRLFKAMSKKPLLIVRGETSDILSSRTALRMARRHGDAKTVTVPGVGHAPMLNEPAAVEAVKTFLATLERRDDDI